MTTIIQMFKLSIYGIFFYLEIPLDLMLIYTTFILLDTLAGCTSAIRLGKKFNIRLLRWGVLLKVAMLIIPFSVALLAKGLEYDFKTVTKYVIKILIASEFISLIGHVYVIKTKKDIEKIDIVSMMLISLRKMTEGYVKQILRKIEKTGNCENKK